MDNPNHTRPRVEFTPEDLAFGAMRPPRATKATKYPPDPRGYVYFIQEETSILNFDAGPIKIGWAASPEKRLAGLRTGQSRGLRLLGAVPGTKGTEKHLHACFADTRIRGEWFRPQRRMFLIAEGKLDPMDRRVKRDDND